MEKRIRRKERNKIISFFVSDDEKEAIAECAARLDMSVSDLCRKTLLKNNGLLQDDGE